MDDFYGEQHKQLQQVFDTRQLADRVKEIIVLPEISDEHQAFIESREMFFLSTIDHRGFPTCSHKGGSPGFVKVIDQTNLAFPNYNGNGMFLSMGNMETNNKVGMLFIDFETPHRVRVHGTASIDRNDPLVEEFPGAEMVVRVRISEIFVNCPRYIHTYQRTGTSKYTPRAGIDKPLTPKWKCIDALQDVLPEHEKGLAQEQGGIITPEEYDELVKKGDG